MRTCTKCQGMMLPERVVDMLEGLVGHFYACVNCARREDAEEGMHYLCEERPPRVLVADTEHQLSGHLGGLLEDKRNGDRGGHVHVWRD